MKAILITLFLNLSFSLTAQTQQDWIFRLDENKILVGHYLNSNEFNQIKPELQLISEVPFGEAFTRTFQWQDKHSVFEFFNGTAIKFDQIVKAQDLDQVQFSRIPFSVTTNEVTFIINIDSALYHQLTKTVKSTINIQELAFFGEFYLIDHENVLVKWNNHFSKSKYAILKDIRSMIAIDPALAGFLGEQTNRFSSDWADVIENEEYKKVEFQATSSNLNDIKNRIAALLNLSPKNLDFTLKSIQNFENALIWNCDQLSKYEVFDLCYLYMGETLRRAYGLNWVEDNNHLILVDKDAQKLEFDYNLQRGILHSDYRPDIMWVAESLKKELED